MTTARIVSLGSLAGRSGHGVRVAVIDSGVHASHPHVDGISSETAFDDAGRPAADTVDRLGHGTAVAAAIREKAPDAELLSVKVFDRSLAATAAALAAAIHDAAAAGARIINMSLGTTNEAHGDRLLEAVRSARATGSWIVAAAPTASHRWLPGAFEDVIAVELDWECPRHECRVRFADDNRVVCRASGYPRPIPGVPPERNVKGQSFAVANATGLLALLFESTPIDSISELRSRIEVLRQAGISEA